MTRRRQFLIPLVLTALSAAACASQNSGPTTDHENSSIAGHGQSYVAGAAGSTLSGASGRSASTAAGARAAGLAGASGNTVVTIPSGAAGARGQAGQVGSVAGQSGSAGTAGSVASAGVGAAGSGTAGGASPSAGTSAPAPICMSKAPDEFELNTSIGGGAGNHKDSAHFALYSASDPDTVLNFMESAHKCFIEDWCFRSPGLSAKSDDGGPYYKTNIYSKAAMSAGGLTYWDANAQLAYITILAAQIGDPKTTVHEYGHAITMSEHTWIDQKRTGFWWETVANWVAYTFLSSDYCADARTAFNVKPLSTVIDPMHTLNTVYGQSYTVICNDQNYYQAWPFFTYLTNNPDNYPGLGKMIVADLMRKYQLNSNETPLHTLERLAAPIKVQTILGRYWARLAYMDIGLPVAQKDFLSSRSSLNYAANLDSSGSDMYTVKSNRKPQYGGANITPLKVTGSGDVSVKVTNKGNGLQESNFTATLSIRGSDGTVRYVDLPNGEGSAMIGSGDEASLVVVNTPDMLYQFDPQYIGQPENVGLNYQVQITGAAPSN